MGTQQILLIVLSVIIVGAAIAVGIQMFNSQAYSANKSAIAADAQSFATQVVQYYKTPASQGGAGAPTAVTNMTAAKIFPFLGWATATESNDNGSYTVANAVAGTAPVDMTVTITGVGKEVKGGKVPQIVTTVSFPSCVITAVASDITKP